MTPQSRSTWWTVCLLGVVACGGHTLDLDHAPPTNGSADAGSDPSLVETAQTPEDLIYFSADDSRIYWITSAGHRQSCVYEQCATTLANYGDDFATGGFWMLPTNTELLFPNDDYVVAGCAKTGCVGAPRQVVRDTATVRGLVSEGDYLYWFSSFDIYRCPAANCGDIPEVVAARQAGNTLRVQGATAYWTSAFPELGWLLSAPVAGSRPPTILVPSGGDQLGWSGEFAIDAKNAYWLDQTSQIRSCPLTGCGNEPPHIVPTNDALKQELVADVSGLYWFEPKDSGQSPQQNHGSVRYCPSPGCTVGVAPQLLSTGAPRSFRVTPQYLYWDDVDVAREQAQPYSTADRIIHRIAKPAPAQ